MLGPASFGGKRRAPAAMVALADSGVHLRAIIHEDGTVER
jgi:hypothetical protein